MLRVVLHWFYTGLFAASSCQEAHGQNPGPLNGAVSAVVSGGGASLLAIVKRTEVYLFANRSILWGRGMAKTALFSLVFWCLPSFSQTNSPLIPSSLLLLTPVHLRNLTSEPQHLVQAPKRSTEVVNTLCANWTVGCSVRCDTWPRCVERSQCPFPEASSLLPDRKGAWPCLLF